MLFWAQKEVEPPRHLLVISARDRKRMLGYGQHVCHVGLLRLQSPVQASLSPLDLKLLQSASNQFCILSACHTRLCFHSLLLNGFCVSLPSYTGVSLRAGICAQHNTLSIVGAQGPLFDWGSQWAESSEKCALCWYDQKEHSKNRPP